MKILLLSILVLFTNAHRPPRNIIGRNAAHTILKTMDDAYTSKNFDQFVSLHSDNFRFHLCRQSGGKSDLQTVLDNDMLATLAVKSKHSLMDSPVPGGTIKIEGDNYSFRYEEHLLLANEEVYRTEGVIVFQVIDGQISITLAEEECPKKIFKI